ncbi:MAG: radical SAM protein [Endomicrobiales bacterium]
MWKILSLFGRQKPGPAGFRARTCGKLGIEFPINLDWRPTYSCNLDCTYCADPKPRFTPQDYRAITEKIIALAPKYIWIGGGEPTLVRQLPEIVRRLKSTVDPFIAVNTNLVNIGLLEDCLPWLDNVITSLDTLDPVVGKKYRGVDPCLILENLRKLVALKDREHLDRLCFSVNSVILKEALDGPGIEELSLALEELGHIAHSFMPALPRNSPYSIIGDARSIERFYELTRRLLDKGRNLIDIPSSPSRTTLLPETVRCFRRYFRARLEPSGAFAPACPMTAPADARCAAPCSCDPAIDRLLFPGDRAPVDVPVLNGRFTGAEIAQLTGFVRRYIDPTADEEQYSSLLRPRASASPET